MKRFARTASLVLLFHQFLSNTGSAFVAADPSRRLTAICFATAPKRGNSNAKQIMDSIKARYDEEGDSTDWTKTRNYLYRAAGNRLSLQQVSNVLEFLEQVFPNDLVQRILTTSPRILRKDVSTQLKPTHQFLQQLYGETMYQEAISRNPDLLLSSGVGYGGPNQEEIEAFLITKLGLTNSHVTKLKKKAPFLFRLSADKMNAVVDLLDSILKRGNCHDSMERQHILAKLVVSYPALMNLSVEENLQPSVTFLMEACHLKENIGDMATLIKSSPGILGLSVKENLQPTIEFLLKEVLQEDTELLRKCVLRHSQLLALSLSNLRQKVDYFNAIDGLAPSKPQTSLACRIATQSPAVYSLSLKENVVPTVEFLGKVWGTTIPRVSWQKDGSIMFNGEASSFPESINSTVSVSSFLCEFPGILTLSLEGNIQPTLTFFNRTGYTSLDDDWRLVPGKRPIRGRYIAASLFNRLLPRWHHLIANGWALIDNEEYSSSTSSSTTASLPPLALLVGATDRDFCKQLKFEYEDYATFKDESVPRLKFSSQFDTWLKTGRPIDVQ